MSTNSNTLLSQQTGHKYTFQLELKKLYVNPSLPFQAKIVWARGQQRIQSQLPIKFQARQTQITLQECFCNKSTVLFNSKTRQFRKKQSKIVVILYANGSPKQGGEYVINLCQILDPYNIKKVQQKTYRVVTRQQKPRCQIQFKLTAQYCQQMIRDQQKSIGSGVGSISSKNTTNLMSSQPKNYVQKKNLFLYEAPSKDNQSVVSYTSYNTGMVRYNSNRKERDDSSVKKQDYGLLSKRQSGNDFFNKTANMKSNISQQYDLKSKNGGYNRYTQSPFDNKTQNFEQNSNKLLVDQQSKRSKLQAQVTRLNIYMKQQSNKLSEYITDNTRLKQQLNRLSTQNQSSNNTKLQSTIRQYQQTIGKIKRQNDDLHNRAFQLNNQNRQIHRKLQNAINQRQRIQQDLRRLNLQKQRAQTKFQSLNRGMQTIIATKQMSSKELENLRDQLQHIKSLNSNLRQNLDRQRKRNQQLQHHNQYQLTNVQDGNKKKQQRIYELERQNANILTQIRQREKQLQSKKEIVYRLERTNQEYKNKIIYNENQKNHLLQENKTIKAQNLRLKNDQLSQNDTLIKIRDEKTAQYQQKNISLQNINYQYLQKIRSLEYEFEQNKKNNSQISMMNETLKRDLQDKKNQIYRLETNIKGLKDIENKYYSTDKILTDKDREISYIRQENNKYSLKVNQLEDNCRKLTIQLEQAKRKVRQNNHPNVDVNQILRQSVQMQVQLKFKTDQLLRLKGVQEKFQEYKYRLQIQERNRHDLQQDIERVQKQLKDKNKMYLIEVEKGKLFVRQKGELQKQYQNTKSELKHCQQIIFNGDKQVKDMQGHIQFLQTQNRKLVQKLNITQQQLKNTKIKAADTSRFEGKIKQLEKQISQKTYTVSLLTSNINSLQKKNNELEAIVKYQESQLQGIKRSQKSASQKMIELQQTKNVMKTQLQKVSNQKKAAQIKCQMIMQQLHALKKSFEQEKGRSTSIVSIRSSEQQVRIRQLQNDLQKKDKLISKLTKQKLQIEEENINLHVQVMKKLSQMQKGKDQGQTPSSQKNMVTPK